MHDRSNQTSFNKPERNIITARNAPKRHKPASVKRSPVGHEAFLSDCIKSGATVSVILADGESRPVVVYDQDKYAVLFGLPNNDKQRSWIFKHAIIGFSLTIEPPKRLPDGHSSEHVIDGEK